MRFCILGRENHLVAHTHHIHTRGSGGTDDPDNLIVVCPFHHDQIHRGYIVLDGCQIPRRDAKSVIEGADAVRDYLTNLQTARPPDWVRRYSQLLEGTYEED